MFAKKLPQEKGRSLSMKPKRAINIPRGRLISQEGEA